MQYELRLEPFFGHFTISEAADAQAKNERRNMEKLRSITDFAQRLRYYNRHICSLAFQATKAEIHYPKSTEGGIRVYCISKTCRELHDANTPEETIIYLQQRAAEIKRIARGLAKLPDYSQKWTFFLSLPGGSLNRLSVWPNVPDDESGEGTGLQHKEAAPIIDLTPETDEEMMAYNKLAEAHFIANYRTPEGGFTRRYTGFSFTKEQGRLDAVLTTATHPDLLVADLITRIEKHFNYPEPQRQPNTTQGNRAVSTIQQMEGQFHALALHGADAGLDLTSQRLTDFHFEMHEHYRQIYLFYKYLLGFRKAGLDRDIAAGTEGDNENGNKDFTVARQVLAIYYLLKYAKAPVVDKAVTARFIQFITGRQTGAKEIKNTNIYKRLGALLHPNERTAKADLQFVQKQFQDIGLNEISKMIENELSKGND